MSGARSNLVPLVVPFLLLALRGRYIPCGLLLVTGLIVSLGFSLAVIWLPGSPAFARLAACWLAAPVVFYVAGLWALAAFALLYCLNELLRWKSAARALLGLVSLAVAPLWLYCSPDLGLDQVSNPWGKGLALAVAAISYALAPAAAVGAGLYHRVKPIIPPDEENRRHKSHHGRKSRPARRSFQWWQSPWAPDGHYLYFCSAPPLPLKSFRQIKHDLERIRYDIETDSWGEREMVVAAQDSGLSAAEPRVSPDGRWLLFCLSEHGNFPIYQQSSDLYAVDLGTRAFRRRDINSNQADSWHCWSSNGPWVVFSSKRLDGLFARPHFTYVDAAGHFH